MFLINKVNNSIQPLSRRSFAELGFRERAHLQEWIAGNPDCLGEKLLIIQKEFSGFSETNERLDLLALDKDGNLVVIENKLDDSGRDVTWQSIKYAAYCSTFSKKEIEDTFQSYLNQRKTEKTAREILEEFFDETPYADIKINKGSTQRIILVAANFRKEVTSAVLWLMSYGIKLKCFKATPYEFGEQYLLTLDQIIPTIDAQEYQISMAHKVQEDTEEEFELKARHRARQKFWVYFLAEIKGKSNLYQNSNASKDSFLVAGGADITYVTFHVAITKSDATVQINFGLSSAQLNKFIFDVFEMRRSEIDLAFGDGLNWERMDQKKSSRISITQPALNYFNEEDWPAIVAFLIENCNKIYRAFQPYFAEVKSKLNSYLKEHKDVEVVSEENG